MQPATPHLVEQLLLIPHVSGSSQNLTHPNLQPRPGRSVHLALELRPPELTAATPAWLRCAACVGGGAASCWQALPLPAPALWLRPVHSGDAQVHCRGERLPGALQLLWPRPNVTACLQVTKGTPKLAVYVCGTATHGHEATGLGEREHAGRKVHMESGTQRQCPASTGPGCLVASATPAGWASFACHAAGCLSNRGVTFTEGSLHARLESTVPAHTVPHPP